MTYRKINEIVINPKNPRLIRDDKFERLKKSLNDFPSMLKKRPIIINEDGIILGGNMRFRAAKDLGMKEIPVEVFTRSDAEQSNKASGQSKTYEQLCDEFIIKDNSSFGEWDWEVLANEWDANELTDWGIDLPKYDSEGGVPSEQPEQAWFLSIEFKSEKECQSLFDELTSKGYECKIVQ